MRDGLQQSLPVKQTDVLVGRRTEEPMPGILIIDQEGVDMIAISKVKGEKILRNSIVNSQADAHLNYLVTGDHELVSYVIFTWSTYGVFRSGIFVRFTR